MKRLAISERKQYSSLDLNKRQEIENLFNKGYGVREIADLIDVCYATIYRELKINNMTPYSYNAQTAQNNVNERKKLIRIERRKQWEKEHATKN